LTTTQVLTRRGAVALAILAAIGAVAAYITMPASANGRSLDGAFCTLPVPPATAASSHICMSLTWDGVTYGTANPDAQLTLRPGTYWITVNDDSAGHNFSLRSCPGSTDACVAGTADSTSEDITTIGETPGEVTVKMNLSHGTYRLYCSTGGTGSNGHEARGMRVDFAVGGVGQVG
jgi:hypothetical protein